MAKRRAAGGGRRVNRGENGKKVAEMRSATASFRFILTMLDPWACLFGRKGTGRVVIL